LVTKQLIKMKKIVLLFTLLLGIISTYPQVQNSNLAKGLLLQVGGESHAQPEAELTSGSLVSGSTYFIGKFETGDDFTNVGGTNVSGCMFKATGTTPTTWTNGSMLRTINQYAGTSPDPSYKMTNSGAIPTYGHKGNNSYFKFDGVDDYISLGDADRYTMPNDVFSFIVKVRTNLLGVDKTILSKYESAVKAEYLLRINTTGKLVFSIMDSGATTNYSSWTTNTNVISVNTVYTIALVYSSGTLTMYIDGTSVASTKVNTGSGFSVFSNTEPALKLGRYPGGTDQLSGSIFGLQQFNYALSTSDVTYYSNLANHPKLVDQTATGTVLTSGTLVTGRSYLIINWITDDDFTNIGGTNADGTVFTATGTTPTHWVHSSTVVEQGATLILSPEGMISPTLWRDYYHSIDIPLSGVTAPRLVKSWAGMNAWRFDGQTNKLAISSAIDGLIGDITISCWMYQSYWDVTYGPRIFDNGKCMLYTLSGGTLGFRRDGGTSIVSGASIGLNGWYHVVVTSTSTGITNFYVNGVLSGTANQSAGTPVSSTTYCIGNQTANTRVFKGVIEGFKITKGIWSAEQIALDYGIYND